MRPRQGNQCHGLKVEIDQHQGTKTCLGYRCGRSHQGTCPAIDKKCHNCLKMGHYATNCKSPKATASATSTSTVSMGQLMIVSAHNPVKLDLVEIKVENIDGRREKAQFLPDMGVKITAFQPEILPQLGMSVDNLKMVATVPKSADGSNLKTLGAVDIQLSKSGHTTEFITSCGQKSATADPFKTSSAGAGYDSEKLSLRAVEHRQLSRIRRRVNRKT